MRVLARAAAAAGAAFLLHGLLAPPAAARERQVSPQELYEMLQSEEPPLVIDVRSPREYGEGHVPGAINVPHKRMRFEHDEYTEHLEKPVVIYCEKGLRARISSEFFRMNGYQDIVRLRGEMPGWHEAGLPVERLEKAAARSEGEERGGKSR